MIFSVASSHTRNSEQQKDVANKNVVYMNERILQSNNYN